VEEKRQQLLEAIADVDDSIAEKVLNNQLLKSLRRQFVVQL